MNDKNKGNDEIAELIVTAMGAVLILVVVLIPKAGFKLGKAMMARFGWYSLPIPFLIASGSALLLEFGDQITSTSDGYQMIGFFLLGALPLLGFCSLVGLLWEAVAGTQAFKGKEVAPFLGHGKNLTKGPRFGSEAVMSAFAHQHQVVFGTPGSGKTFSTLEPQALEAIQRGERVFIIDPKGDSSFRDAVYTFCKSVERENDFFYLSMSNPEISDCFNPFGDCNPNEIKDMIISATDWSEPHYRKMAELHVLKAVQKLKSSPSLEDILRILPNMKELTGISADLELMVRSEYGRLVNNANAPSMFDLYARNSVVFISLDTQAYPEASVQLGRLFLGAILSVSNRVQTQIREEERAKTTVIVDEFGSFLTEAFVNFISKARSSNFRIILATQSIGDLERFRPEMRKRIMDSVSNKIVLRMSDPESIEFCSMLFGTKTTTKETEQLEDTFLFGKKKTGVMSSREVEEFIVHPSDIRSLNTGEGFAMSQNPYSVFRVRFQPPHLGVEKANYAMEANPIRPSDLSNEWEGMEEVQPDLIQTEEDRSISDRI